MIKQTFFYLLISLSIYTTYGCVQPNAGEKRLFPDSRQDLAPISWRHDALSAYYLAEHGMLQEKTITEAQRKIHLISIQGRWVDKNLWGEWEYTFAADQKQWTYDSEGLRFMQGIDNTKPPPDDVAPAIETLLSELSTQRDAHPPLLSEKRLAKVTWTPTLGWVYNTSLESNRQ